MDTEIPVPNFNRRAWRRCRQLYSSLFRAIGLLSCWTQCSH